MTNYVLHFWVAFIQPSLSSEGFLKSERINLIYSRPYYNTELTLDRRVSKSMYADNKMNSCLTDFTGKVDDA